MKQGSHRECDVYVYSKKIGFTEPVKKVPEMSKSIKRLRKSQKNDKKIYETLKGSDGGHKDETMLCESLF